MTLKNIINNWHSDEIPNDKNYLILSELVKHYNKLPNNNLIILYNIDKVFDTFCWLIDKNNGTLYKINLYLNNELVKSKNNDKDILDSLEMRNYTKLNFYLSNLKRFEFCNKRNLSTAIIIQIVINEKPEYFKINDLKTEELSINHQINNKRKFDKLEKNKNKRQRLLSEENIIDWNTMYSASKVKNYLNKDPVLDYFQYHKTKSIYDVPNKKMENSNSCISNSGPKYEAFDEFTKYLLHQGLLFENEIYKKLKHNHSVVQVAESYQARSIEKYQETIEHMKKGVNVIYQGVLHDYRTKIYGVPDFLVRSDYLNKLIGYNIYDDSFGSPKLNVSWHYVIVDVKHTTLTLSSDGILLRNNDNIPFYKGQLLIYTMALNEALGTKISKAFILGKRYVWECKNVKTEINNSFDKLGIIDYNNQDKFIIDEVNDALKWLKVLREDSHTWKLLPSPSNDNLYPNMKNDKDGAFHQLKKELANTISELTLLPYVSVKHRKTAFQNGIYGWNDPKCISRNLGFNNGVQSKIVDAVSNINRQEEDLVLPKKIHFDCINWRNEKSNELWFYIDYETLHCNFNKILTDFSKEENFDYIYMIGVGLKNNENKWEFANFTLDELTKEKENKMLVDFWKYIHKKLLEYNKKEPVFVHWSHAEKTLYKKAQLRHLDLRNKKFIDLYQVFINEPISVKGAFSYSLKEIARALYKNNLIKTIWKTSNACSDGRTSMVLANQCYQQNRIVTKDLPIMKDIIDYNEIDCKCMWEIIEYLRKNH
jgi:hypothetical protein